MKLTVGVLIAASAILLKPAHADEGRTFDGTPVLTRSVPLHVHGKPVTAQLFVASLHMMDHSGFQPVGLWEYFYVLPDSGSGNALNCERWFNQVLDDEHAQTPSSPTHAWLEIQLSNQAVPIQTDEGTSLISDSGIRCWEALEFSER